MDYKIALIRGDGIGPEVVGEAVKVMETVGAKFGHSFEFTDVMMGGCAIDAVGKSYPDGTAEKCKACDAVLLGAVLFYALFAVSFALYGLPLAAVWYPAALTAVLGLIFFLCDFGRIRRTHAELSALSNVSAEQIGPLPETSRILDGDYQAIIRSLQVQARQLASSAAAREREARDYYTVWAHQIKTPLAAMRLLLQDAETDEQRALRRDGADAPAGGFAAGAAAAGRAFAHRAVCRDGADLSPA